jgi:uncharacterized protein (DUF433 family)
MVSDYKMNEDEYKEYMDKNPALYDPDKDDGKLIFEFFDNFERACVREDTCPIMQEEFPIVFSGSRFVAKDGFMHYTFMQNIISLAFRVFSEYDANKRDEKVKELYEKIKQVKKYFNSTEYIYQVLILALDCYRKCESDENLMLDILSGMNITDSPTLPVFNADVFCEHVKLSSVGQLLNYDIGRKYRSEIILCEMRKGLRDDKEGGIPVSDILELFTNKDSIMVINKFFDISFILVEVYNILYAVGNLDEYIASQTRNYDLQFKMIQEADREKYGMIDNSVFLQRVKDHYNNLMKIFETLLEGSFYGNAYYVHDYSFAHLLIQVPPEKFFIRPSYESCLLWIYNGILKNTSDKSRLYYYNVVNDIISIVPNLDIPRNIILDICKERVDARERMISSIRLGFMRYALFVTDSIEQSITRRINDIFLGADSDGKSIDYLSMGLIDRIKCILGDEAYEAYANREQRLEQNQQMSARNREMREKAYNELKDENGEITPEQAKEIDNIGEDVRETVWDVIADSQMFREGCLGEALIDTNNFINMLRKLDC